MHVTFDLIELRKDASTSCRVSVITGLLITGLDWTGILKLRSEVCN